MKETLRGIGEFLLGLALWTPIFGAAWLLGWGLDLLSKRTPSNALGILALGIYIFLLFYGVIVAFWISEKLRRNRPVEYESNPLTENEQHKWDSNLIRGSLCLLTGFLALMMTSDMENTQARLALCAIAAIMAWSVTAVRKIKTRPGLYALALLCVWLSYGGGICVWDGMTHVGPGKLKFGGESSELYGDNPDAEEHWDTVSQSDYRRHSLNDGLGLGLLDVAAVMILIGVWRQKDALETEREALEKHWKEAISNPETLVDIHKHPEFYREDFRRWVSENYPDRLKTRTLPPNSPN